MELMTAKEAREMSNYGIELAFKSEIKRITEMIHVAVNTGDISISVQTLDERVAAVLTEKGYTIKRWDGRNETDYTISW